MNFVIQSTFDKTKSISWTLALSTISFVLLFHKADVGLNLALFDLLVFGFWISTHPSRFKEPMVIVSSLALIITSICTAWYGTPETIFWSIVCVFLLSQQMAYPDSSILFFETKSFVNLFAAPVMAVNNYLNENRGADKGQRFLRGLIVVGIPLTFTFIFASLYQNLNPFFEKAYNGIIDLIDLSIVLTIILGIYVSLTIFKTLIPEKITALDKVFGNVFVSNAEKKTNKNALLEKQTGMALFGMLNLVLLIFLVSDIAFVTKLQAGASDDYSRYVHEGIGIIIFSILIATSFILFFFRGKEFSSLPNHHWLKRLALLWVILNIGILMTTGFKNAYYIIFYGLTLKRIGVFIYLILAMSGLCFAFAKVYFGCTNAYLIRKVYWSFFIILTLNIAVDWSTIITRFNIHENIKDHRTLDWRYLLSLDERVLPTITFYQDQLRLTPSENIELNQQLKTKISQLQTYNPEWREMHLSTNYAQSYFEH